jgi:nucleotide-binding universal stress UspA family protein
LRHAPCSIEVIRSIAGQRAEGDGLKILLATEGSSCSVAAARALASQLWNKIAEVKVISVVQETSPAIESFAGLALMSAVLPEQIGEQLRAAAKLATAEARSILEAKRIAVSEEVLFGDVKMNITEYAKEWGADVIIVGSHGRHGIERVFEGSISESVALHAPCSVAVIHEPTQ